MRIGVNLLYLLPGVVGGTETYAAGLLHGLAELGSTDEFFVFVNLESSDWPLPEADNIHRVVCPVRAVSRARRYLYEQAAFPMHAQRYRLDVLHSLGYVSPLYYRGRSVVTIHDIVYDNPGSILRRAVLRLMIGQVIRRTAAIITISHHSKTQIASRLGVQPDRIVVTYLAPKIPAYAEKEDWPALKKRLGIRGSYLLALSSPSPHKNIPALVEAFADIVRVRPAAPQLVLAGHMPAHGVSLHDLLRSFRLENHAVLTGYLPDSELISLYRHAEAFVFPSLYEGFGLPILEAMAYGTPVACSNIASLPEVAGDAALIFDPCSPDRIAAALRTLLDDADLRAEMVRKGYENLERFSWLKTARETMNVYREVAGQRQEEPCAPVRNGDGKLPSL